MKGKHQPRDIDKETLYRKRKEKERAKSLRKKRRDKSQSKNERV